MERSPHYTNDHAATNAAARLRFHDFFAGAGLVELGMGPEWR